MKDWMKAILHMAEAGTDGVLVTVAASVGSVPRGAGAHLVVTADTMQGTIGGGSVEAQAIQQAKELLEKKTPGRLLQYLAGGALEAAAAGHPGIDTGMICGGSLTVLLQYLEGRSSQLQQLAEDLRSCTSGTRNRQRGETPCLVLEQKAGIETAEVLWLPDQKEILFYAEDPEGQTGWQYMEPLMTSGRVFLFGGGHIAGELVPLLQRLDFPCVVTDCRQELLKKEAFREAETVCCSYEQAPVFSEVNSEDFICIMSHGHEYDYELLTQALKTPAAYIGVLGSRRKQGLLQKRLEADGFDSTDRGRYQLPMGMEIGSDTPAEIAVSIAAELIRRRSGKSSGKNS